MLGRTTIAIKPMGHKVCDAAERQQNKLMHLLFKKEYLLIGHEVLKQLVPISRRVSLDVALFAPYSLFFFVCIPGVLWIKELFEYLKAVQVEHLYGSN